MPIRVFATNDIPTASDLNNGPFSDAVVGNVATEESTSSASYGDLTTTGPTASGVQLVAGQQAMVIVQALMINQTVSGGSLMSFTVSGVEAQAASDTNAAWTRSTERTMATRISWYTAGTGGSHTFTSKFKVEAAGTAAFASRRILVKRF